MAICIPIGTRQNPIAVLGRESDDHPSIYNSDAIAIGYLALYLSIFWVFDEYDPEPLETIDPLNIIPAHYKSLPMPPLLRIHRSFITYDSAWRYEPYEFKWRGKTAEEWEKCKR